MKLDSEPTANVTIDVASNQAAVSVSPASHTFTATNWQTAKSFTVRTQDDADGDDLEATLTHTLTPAEGSDYTAETIDVAVTVNDDESPSTGATLRVEPPTVGEGAGQTVTVRGTLNRAVLRADVAMTVSVAGATATAADFAAVAAVPLVIEAGDSSGTATFTLTPVDDDIDEPDETLTVSGQVDATSPAALADGVTAATLTITDNDNPPTLARLEVVADRLGEANETTTLTAYLSNRSSAATVVGLTVPVGAEAVTLSPNPLTIPAETESGTVTVTGEPDTAYTSHRPVTLRGRVTSPASTVQREVRLTVLDDDPPEVTGNATPTVTEGNDRAVATYTVRNHPAGVRLVWAVVGAADASAFAIDANGRLRFDAAPDHERQASYRVTVQAADESLPEVTLTGTLAVTVTVADAPGRVNLSPPTPRVGSRLAATVSDRIDEVGTVTEWCWARSALSDFPDTLEHPTTELGCTTSNPTETATYTVLGADLNHHLRATVTYTDGENTSKTAGAVTTAPVSPRPPSPSGGGGGAGGGSGGGGGGSGDGGGGTVADDHGDTPAQATPVVLHTAQATPIPGRLHAPDDVDYFEFSVPRAGQLVVETTGPTDTAGKVWQDGAILTSADSGGERQNFRLHTPVAPRPVVVAVEGQNGQTGAYTLEARMVAGVLENPDLNAFQSGIGVISGWVCEAEVVEIELNGARQEAAYGTERLDTEPVCGDADNGFGLLFNWNLLGDGEHEVVAWVDGVELGLATVRVTTLGTEFLRDAGGECVAEDFPDPGETVTVVWQQAQQNFVLARGQPPAPAPGRRDVVGALENPDPAAFQSGIGVLSGWVCEAETVEIGIGTLPLQGAAYGTERLDTAGVCGDTGNGFGLLFNWNLLEDGGA